MTREDPVSAARTGVLQRVPRIVRDLTRRSTVQHVRAHGPIPHGELATAADEVRAAAVELLIAGYERLSDAAMVLADRLDETAELAHVLELHATRRAAA